jgi:hypothetical protein
MNRGTRPKYQVPEMLATEGSTERRLLQTVVENATLARRPTPPQHFWMAGMLSAEFPDPVAAQEKQPDIRALLCLGENITESACLSVTIMRALMRFVLVP